jgi:hypothetical protein
MQDRNCESIAGQFIVCNKGIRKLQQESLCVERGEHIFATRGGIPKGKDVTDLLRTRKMFTDNGDRLFKLYSVKNNGSADGIKVRLGHTVSQGMYEIRLDGPKEKGVVKTGDCSDVQIDFQTCLDPEKTKAGEPIAFCARKEELFRIQKTELSNEALERLEEVKKIYSDLMIRPKLENNDIVGLYVTPTLYGSGDTMMMGWFSYVSSGKKPKAPKSSS